jgi:uncharacterized membrane protein YqiK
MFENPVLLIMLFIITIALFGLVIIFKSYKKPKEGEALLISGARGKRVTFSGTIVIPFLEKVESVSIKIHQIEVFLEGKSGIVTKDNIIADVKATFSVRVNLDPIDIIRVALTYGSQLTYNKEEVSQIFRPKFGEIIRVGASALDFEAIKNQPEAFKMEVFNGVGMDLNGFMLDDLAINYLTATAKRLDI